MPRVVVLPLVKESLINMLMHHVGPILGKRKTELSFNTKMCYGIYYSKQKEAGLMLWSYRNSEIILAGVGEREWCQS